MEYFLNEKGDGNEGSQVSKVCSFEYLKRLLFLFKFLS